MYQYSDTYAVSYRYHTTEKPESRISRGCGLSCFLPSSSLTLPTHLTNTPRTVCTETTDPCKGKLLGPFLLFFFFILF